MVETKEGLQTLVEDILKKQGAKYSALQCKVRFGTWHPEMDIYFVVDGFMRSVSFKNMPSGCGLILMHGFSLYGSFDMKPILDTIAKQYATDGAVTIIATLGGDNHDSCKELVRLGFIPTLTYPNLRHCSGYKQTLWHKTIDR